MPEPRAGGATGAQAPCPGAAARACIACVRFYQRRIAWATRGWCRFEPSCSSYAIGAYERHGALRGTVLAAWRIVRCNPWGGCGHDPVP
jgi:putative membrane protein insertion efficiency factor